MLPVESPKMLGDALPELAVPVILKMLSDFWVNKLEKRPIK